MRARYAALVAAWSTVATAGEGAPMRVEPACLEVLARWAPPAVGAPDDPGASAEVPQTVGTLLTKDFLQKIPTGRSYQDAVRMSVADTVPAVGPSLENTYMIDGAVVTDPVTGTYAANYGGPSSSPALQVPPELPAGVPIGGFGPAWGGTVYLSNDDGGALASAQRVLDRLDQGAPIDPAEVRPHELLNAFTFPTVAVADGETFAVRPSAFTVGRRLELALVVQTAHPPRPPIDLTLVIDRSGSMDETNRMPLVHRALERIGAGLRPGDTVDVVLFDDVVCTAVQDFTAGRDDPRLWSTMVAGIVPRGSTDLNAGLQQGYALARAAEPSPDRLRRVVLFTDALLNTGVTDVGLVTEVGRAFDERGIRLTAAGLGDDFRDDVLWELTEKGRGAYVFLGREEVVDRMFDAELDRLLQVVAEDVRFALHLPDALGIRRFFGEEASFDARDVRRVHLGAGERQVFLQELELRGEPSTTDVVTFEVSWRDPGGGDRRATFAWSVPTLLQASPAAARKAVALVSWAEVPRQQFGCMAPREAWRRAAASVGVDPEIASLARRTDAWCKGGTKPEFHASSGHVYSYSYRHYGSVASTMFYEDAIVSCVATSPGRLGFTPSVSIRSAFCPVLIDGAVPALMSVDTMRTIAPYTMMLVPWAQ